MRGFSTGDRHPEPVTLAHPTRPARATPDTAHRAAWARRPDLADRVRTRDAREAFQVFFTGAGGRAARGRPDNLRGGRRHYDATGRQGGRAERPG